MKIFIKYIDGDSRWAGFNKQGTLLWVAEAF